MLFAFLYLLHPARDMAYLLECLSGKGAPSHKKKIPSGDEEERHSDPQKKKNGVF